MQFLLYMYTLLACHHTLSVLYVIFVEDKSKTKVTNMPPTSSATQMVTSHSATQLSTMDQSSSAKSLPSMSTNQAAVQAPSLKPKKLTVAEHNEMRQELLSNNYSKSQNNTRVSSTGPTTIPNSTAATAATNSSSTASGSTLSNQVQTEADNTPAVPKEQEMVPLCSPWGESFAGKDILLHSMRKIYLHSFLASVMFLL